jgi:hypothetical protein
VNNANSCTDGDLDSIQNVLQFSPARHTRRDVNIFVGCDARLLAEVYQFQHLFLVIKQY